MGLGEGSVVGVEEQVLYHDMRRMALFRFFDAHNCS